MEFKLFFTVLAYNGVIMNVMKRVYHLIFVILLPFYVCAKQPINLPDLGSASDQVLSERKEKEYRDEALKKMYQYDVLVKDPIIQAYVHHLGYRLVAYSNKPSDEFDFFVIPWNVVNASAYPGGLIVVYAGLIMETSSESELAGVLAHEIAHVNQRHISRQMVKQKNATIPFLLGLAAAIAAAQNSSSDDAGMAVAAGATALQQQMSINFTRFNEYEADRVGIGILHASGFNPEGMADFFSALMRKNRVDERFKIPEYSRTHPLSINRVAEAKNRIKALGKTEIRESLLYDFVKERVRNLIKDDSINLTDFYRKAIHDRNHQVSAMRYGYALHLIEANKPQQAIEQLQKIIIKPEIVALIEHAQISALSKISRDEAIVKMNNVLVQYPDDQALKELAVNLFIQHGSLSDRDRAVNLARQLTTRYPKNPYYFELLSIAAHHAIKPIRAGEAMARREHLIGRNYRAVRILKNLLKEEISYYQRAEINALISEYEQLITASERRTEIAMENKTGH